MLMGTDPLVQIWDRRLPMGIPAFSKTLFHFYHWPKIEPLKILNISTAKQFGLLVAYNDSNGGNIFQANACCLMVHMILKKLLIYKDIKW